MDKKQVARRVAITYNTEYGVSELWDTKGEGGCTAIPSPCDMQVWDVDAHKQIGGVIGFHISVTVDDIIPEVLLRIRNPLEKVPCYDFGSANPKEFMRQSTITDELDLLMYYGPATEEVMKRVRGEK